MLTPGINFINFKSKYKSLKLRKKLNKIIQTKNPLIESLSNNYKNSFKKKNINFYKKYSNYRVIGMGGSSLGTQAIYDFLKSRIKKKFLFFDNLKPFKKKDNKRYVNLVVSKSGNTIETIINSNILIKKNDKNIFITENKRNYLYLLAQKLKSEIIHHNNFIGGRYSVLSEVGMLPAELMGLKTSNFKQLNNLIKNKKFLNLLVDNVSATLKFIKRKKFNSVIINYDQKSENLFNWYQQLVAESLGKKNKGILPIVSNMPKDNHSVMQLYLEGFKNNFFTFFYVHEKKSDKINNETILGSREFLKNKSLSDIIYAQKKATENIFKKKIFHLEVLRLSKEMKKPWVNYFVFLS